MIEVMNLMKQRKAGEINSPRVHQRVLNSIHKISQEEMDNLLTKSGLTKLETGVYEDENGSVLAMGSLKQ